MKYDKRLPRWQRTLKIGESPRKHMLYKINDIPSITVLRVTRKRNHQIRLLGKCIDPLASIVPVGNIAKGSGITHTRQNQSRSQWMNRSKVNINTPKQPMWCLQKQPNRRRTRRRGMNRLINRNEARRRHNASHQCTHLTADLGKATTFFLHISNTVKLIQRGTHHGN